MSLAIATIEANARRALHHGMLTNLHVDLVAARFRGSNRPVKYYFLVPRRGQEN
jgi:hypothetical protein